MADALGSISVVISSLFIKFLGWNFCDPLCSILISFIIIYSATPILVNSFSTLTHRLDDLSKNKKKKVEKEIYSLPFKLLIIKSDLWCLNKNNFIFELRIQTHLINHDDITVTNLNKGETIENFSDPTQTEISDRIKYIMKENGIKEYYLELI
jgi:Co/Zn/Cd efflux system component